MRFPLLKLSLFFVVSFGLLAPLAAFAEDQNPSLSSSNGNQINTNIPSTSTNTPEVQGSDGKIVQPPSTGSGSQSQVPQQNQQAIVKANEHVDTTKVQAASVNTAAQQVHAQPMNKQVRGNYNNALNNLNLQKAALQEELDNINMSDNEQAELMTILAAGVQRNFRAPKNNPKVKRPRYEDYAAALRTEAVAAPAAHFGVEVKTSKYEKVIAMDSDGNEIPVLVDNTASSENDLLASASIDFDESVIQKLEDISAGANAEANNENNVHVSAVGGQGGNASSSSAGSPVDVKVETPSEEKLSDKAKALAARAPASLDGAEADEAGESNFGKIAGLLKNMLGLEDEKDPKAAAAGSDALGEPVKGSTPEAPLTLYSGKLAKKPANKTGGIPVGTRTGNGRKDGAPVPVGTRTGNAAHEDKPVQVADAGEEFNPQLIMASADDALPEGWEDGVLGLAVIFLIIALTKALFHLRRKRLETVPVSNAVVRARRVRTPAAPKEEREAYLKHLGSGTLAKLAASKTEDIHLFGFEDTGVTETFTHMSEYQSEELTGTIAPWTTPKEISRILKPNGTFIQYSRREEKWLLVQTNDKGAISKTLGEVSAGTVVDGEVLGPKFPPKRFRLDKAGQWVPTQKGLRLVLAVEAVSSKKPA